MFPETEKRYGDVILSKLVMDPSTKLRLPRMFRFSSRFLAFHKEEIKRIRKAIDDENCAGTGKIFLDIVCSCSV